MEQPILEMRARTGGDDRLVTLDGMRGLAALAVTTGHLGMLGPRSVYGLAVDFFFMLSGFVLLRTYAGKLGDSVSVRRYLARRAIRLVPLLLAGCALGGVAFATGRAPSQADLFWHQRWLTPLDPPGWSLVFEAIASVAIGFGVWRRWGWLQSGLLLLGAAGIVLATVRHGSPLAGWRVGQFHYGLTRMVFGFSAGALVYRLPACRSLPWAGVIVAFILALTLPWHGAFEQVAVVLALYPVLLWVGASAPAMPFGRQLGELSYPLYILHMPLFWLLSPASPAVLLAASIAASVAALLLFDRPVRRRLLRWERRRRWRGEGARARSWHEIVSR